MYNVKQYIVSLIYKMGKSIFNSLLILQYSLITLKLSLIDENMFNLRHLC